MATSVVCWVMFLFFQPSPYHHCTITVPSLYHHRQEAWGRRPRSGGRPCSLWRDQEGSQATQPVVVTWDWTTRGAQTSIPCFGYSLSACNMRELRLAVCLRWWRRIQLKHDQPHSLQCPILVTVIHCSLLHNKKTQTVWSMMKPMTILLQVKCTCAL